jgi:carboxyl-terminal processing protease
MRKFFGIAVLLVIGILLGLYIQPLISGDSIYQQVKKLEYVLNTATKNYVEEVDTQKLVEAAIKGMLGELDVHSVFISAEEQKRVEEDFQGSFEGIGVQFDILNDTIVIVSPIPGGPSEKLGIQSGDKIINIDDSTAVGLDRSRVPKKLRGPKGTIVKVDILRTGEKKLIPYEIERDKIPLNTVDASFIIEGTDIGVITVNRFAQTTHDEMMDSLRVLKTKGMKKLILDLRYNPGGLLNQAYRMTDEFVSRGDTIVYTKGRKAAFDEVYVSDGGTEFGKIPLIVLINEGSASASEIVSGAIQDLDRGLIVGETSYGKGLVQRPYEIGDGSVFRLTIAKYYTPSGRSIQRPYHDKDKYRHLSGRLNLDEGSYIENAIDKIKDQVKKINDTTKNEKDKIDFNSLPLYKTKKGRTVFGGGGITPDYIINQDTITKFSVELRKKNLFLEFTNSYMNTKGKILKDKYQSSFSKFIKEYSLDASALSEFRKMAEAKGITWVDKEFETDKEFILTTIKAYIAQSIWNRSKFNQILYMTDKQVIKASELFPELIKLTNKK